MEIETGMETLIPEISRLLNDTLSPEQTLVYSATEGLCQLSKVPDFPFSVLAITTGGDNPGLKLAASTYLKNFVKLNFETEPLLPRQYSEFRNQLVLALLQAEPSVLKVLVEAFRFIIVKDFVRGDSWPELVAELKAVITNSNLVAETGHYRWKTVNALIVLQVIVKQFQYFLNPKLSREPVPLKLEMIAREILVPLQAAFHHFLDKVLSVQAGTEMEVERVLLITCKCFYFSVRSYMPSALIPLLPSFCLDLYRIVDSLNLDVAASDGRYSLRLKIGKRSLIFFNALITRHRKHADKFMPDIITYASKIAKQSPSIGKMNHLAERIVSLAFDVICHVLETGPGWRMVSSSFSPLLDSAIFPALVLNKKDISMWEEDQEEYIRTNLPSDLEEISGWNEDLFTARKSAINLLGVIALSKGPPTVSRDNTSVVAKRKKGDKNKRILQCSMGELLVMPFLSKFPIPPNAKELPPEIYQDYYGVLIAYGGLQDFLKERNPEYVIALIRTRVLPLYLLDNCSPHLVSAANWVIGELASCLPKEMSADIYRSLMKSITMVDKECCSCYPVRVSGAGAIAELLQNDYVPTEWMPILQVLVNGISSTDENESSLFLQLLSTVVEVGQENVAALIPMAVLNIVNAISEHLPSNPEPWPQVVERGFATLAVMAKTWEDNTPDETENNASDEWRSGWATIARSFSGLLQHAWLVFMQPMEAVIPVSLPPPSSIDDASTMLGLIMRFIMEIDEAADLKITELLLVWAELIADWHAWEEIEDLAMFSCIGDVVKLHIKCDLNNFFMQRMHLQPSAPGPKRSIIENVGSFVSRAILAYPYATWRACSTAHLLLHVPRFSFETESVKKSLTVAFTKAAFTHFRDIRDKPVGLWKPLLLVISSCYICYPENIEKVLDSSEEKGFTGWASALAGSFEPGQCSKSEIKLAVIALSKVAERLLRSPTGVETTVLENCFTSLMEASMHLKEIQEEDDCDDETNSESIDEEYEYDEDDEDSEDSEHEETEEEFLERYAKAAASLESEGVEGGDVEDEVQELELGAFDEVDVQKVVYSLLESHHAVLVKGLSLKPQLISAVLNTFPDYGPFFQISS